MLVPDFEAAAEYAQAQLPGEHPDGQPAVAAVAPRPVEDGAIYLPERDETSRPAGLSLTPPRRLHGKTSPAMLHQLSHVPIEGENDGVDAESPVFSNSWSLARTSTIRSSINSLCSQPTRRFTWLGNGT